MNPIRTEVSNIPDELKERDQWLCYGNDKKPISAQTGNSVEWPRQLSSFEVAKTYADEHFLGLGFCFANQAEFFGVDLDGCVDPKTGVIESWALAVIELLSSYCEISMSFSGIKIISRGYVPGNLKTVEFGDVKHGGHRQQIEFKTDSGYFAITGVMHLNLSPFKLNFVDVSKTHARINIYKRVLAYLVETPTAIQGQGGDVHTFTVVCRLIHGFDLDPRECFWLLSPWNELCVPPWNEKDLRHKIDEANKRTDGNGRQRGYLLEQDSVPILQSVNDFTNKYAPNNAGNSCSKQPFSSDYVAFPTHLLPQPLCQFVTEVSTAIGCDPSFVALPLLSALAAAIGDARKLQAKKGWIVPAILWTAFVGESGTAKSPALRAVMKYPRQRQQQHRQNYEQLRKEYDIEFDAFEAELKRWKNKSLINAGVAKPQPPNEPPFPRTVVNDVTMESLVSILANNPAGLIAVYDELSGWFGGLNKYRSGTDSDGPIWLSIYNAESISVDRKGSGHAFVPSAFVSICGGIQPGLLSNCFTQKHQVSGLLARFLLANPPRILKQWTEDEISDSVDAQMANVFNNLYELQPSIDELENRRPYLLQLSDDAKTALKQFYNQHNKEQLGESGILAAAYSKQEEIPLRLAIVIHCVKQGMGLVVGSVVDVTTMRAAIDLTEWFKNEIRRVYSTLAFENQKSDRERLVEWIKRKSSQVKVRDLQRSSKTKYPNTAIAESALNDLVFAGLGSWEQADTTAKGGRPTKTFRLSG